MKPRASLIDQTFSRLRAQGRRALIGYTTAGFPSKAALLPTIERLQSAGLDVLEIGVPFSDPVADGPTIQRSSQRALENGVTLEWILRTLQRMPRRGLPLILMSYSNPIIAFGVDRFFRRARAAGIAGVIIPDLIPEEGNLFSRPAREKGIDLVYLAAPTTTPARLRRIADATSGFIYAVSLTGITGARAALPMHVADFLRRLRRTTRKPIAIGFGISTANHVRFLRKHVDGVIVGSALITQLEKSLPAAERFVRSLQQALNPNGAKENAHAS